MRRAQLKTRNIASPRAMFLSGEMLCEQWLLVLLALTFGFDRRYAWFGRRNGGDLAIGEFAVAIVV
jgi:hypothetical protein